jgi:hypothetical protein
MLYQLSHVRMPVPSHPGPVRRISPALRQNCIRSWPNHQLGTEAEAKNLSLERTRATPPPPLPQVSRPTSVVPAPNDRPRPASRPVPRPVSGPVPRPVSRLVPRPVSRPLRGPSVSPRRRPPPADPLRILSATPPTAPSGVNGVADRRPLGSLAWLTGPDACRNAPCPTPRDPGGAPLLGNLRR